MGGRKIVLLGLVSGLSMGLYLFASHLTDGIGFPLDDAWIHQTYARNLALAGEWAFIPGQPSSGSTSPLWSTLLAVGVFLEIGPYFWTFLLGWLALWGLSILGASIFNELFPGKTNYGIWVGVFLALEWHLTWSAGSGMETLLFAGLATLVLYRLIRRNHSLKEWLHIGILIGVSVWLRPDGLTLLGPAIFLLVLSKKTWRGKGLAAIPLLAGFVGVFALYLFFNLAISGTWWPNTFYAKQAEYAQLQQDPFVGRLLRQFSQPLIGPGLVLLPGALILFGKSVWQRRWNIVAVFFWMCGYLGSYALRLPVDYQHGRYVVPVMPIYFVLGLVGMVEWILKEEPGRWHWLVRNSWVSILILVTLGMWLLGAQAYGRDVAFIETEMVTVARWLAVNTPKDALIAVHDVGAVGYFSQRDLLDLAGLISPEVIPFIRDEEKLAGYLDEEGADYLVTFPGWYPGLARRGEMVFQTDGTVSSSLGGENMMVYKWGGK